MYNLVKPTKTLTPIYLLVLHNCQRVFSVLAIISECLLTMATAKPDSFVSQDYFDELCLENAELFELSESDAINETIKQLESSNASLEHLSLTFPKSDVGKHERYQRSMFLKAVSDIKSSDGHDSDVCEQLERIRTHLLEHPAIYSTLFGAHQGVTTLLDVLLVRMPNIIEPNEGDSELHHKPIKMVMDTLRIALNCEKSSVYSQEATKRKFQEDFGRLIPIWIDYVHLSLEIEWDSIFKNSILSDLLYLASMSCKRNEDVKKKWMHCQTSRNLKLADVLFQAIDLSLESGDDTFYESALEGCNLISTLCTFDDFREVNEPKVSSAYENVQIFQQYKAVQKLHKLLKSISHASVVSALRSMAIQDSVVQEMVALGVVNTACDVLEQMTHETSSIDFLTAVTGFFRNLCANDDIKTSLCIGSHTIVPYFVDAMQKFPDATIFLEHACGTFAAMALRQPKNAEFLVKCDAHSRVLDSMQRHTRRVTLQRQGALAIRNIASRSPELRSILISAGADHILLANAAKHLSCQDEVYAALRDMGLEVNMMQSETNEMGEVVLTARQSFGEINPNFRPVFD